MGRTGGGSKLAGKLKELEEELHNYFGVLNQLREGLNVTPLEKPEAFLFWEQTQATGLHLVEGGLLDQPYIWMQELAVVNNVIEIHKAARQAQAK